MIRILLFTALLFFPYAVKAKMNCTYMEPKGGADVSEEVKGQLDSDLEGVFSKIVGLNIGADGVYRKIKKETLKDYPNANDLYIKERLLYMKCESINSDGVVTEEEKKSLDDFTSQIFNVNISTPIFDRNTKHLEECLNGDRSECASIFRNDQKLSRICRSKLRSNDSRNRFDIDRNCKNYMASSQNLQMVLFSMQDACFGVNPSREKCDHEKSSVDMFGQQFLDLIYQIEDF